MSLLSNEEKETIISFDETPAEAVIFTYNKRWQTHLEKKLGLKPTMDNKFGGKEYHIAKRRIPLPRAPRKLSPEQREKLGQRLRKARQQKSPNRLRNNTAIKKSEDKNSGETNNIPRSKGSRRK